MCLKADYIYMLKQWNSHIQSDQWLTTWLIIADCIIADFLRIMNGEKSRKQKRTESGRTWGQLICLMFMCTCEITVWWRCWNERRLKRGSRECMHTDEEEWCVQLISRIPHWTFLQGDWEPCCGSGAGVPDEAHDSSAALQSDLSQQEVRRGQERARALEGQALQQALLWLV